MKLINLFQWFFTGKTPRAKLARRTAEILFLLALFVAIFNYIPIQEVIQAISAADPLYLVIGIVLGLMAAFLTALQMTILVRKQGIHLNTWQIFEINLAAKFYAQFLPGNIVASGVKWYRLSKPNGKPAAALAAIAFFRLSEGFINIATALMLWLLSGQEWLELNWYWFIIVITSIVVVWVLLTRYSLPIYKWFKMRVARYLKKPIWQKIINQLDIFVMAVSAYEGLTVWELSITISAGFLSLMVGALSAQALGRAVAVELSFFQMGWIYVVVVLLTQLPFVFLGGLGIREVSLVFMLSLYGIEPGLALAFSFLLFIRGVFVSLIGGLFEAVRALRAHPITDQEAAKENPGEY
jgi:uncharacterized protein (TIRG00374 family)